MEDKNFKAINVQPEMLTFTDKADLKVMKYDELVEMGRGVTEIKIYSQWLLGKLGDAVATKYGNLVTFAKDINQIYNVLNQYVYVYRKFTKEDKTFTPDKYYGAVPWGVLQLVAAKTDKPVELLNELIDGGVNSFSHAYRKIKEKETGQTIPAKPRVSLQFDNEVMKWKIKLRPEDLDLIDWSNVREQLLDYLRSLA